MSPRTRDQLGDVLPVNDDGGAHVHGAVDDEVNVTQQPAT
jgi:hypothetical protein